MTNQQDISTALITLSESNEAVIDAVVMLDCDLNVDTRATAPAKFLSLATDEEKEQLRNFVLDMYNAPCSFAKLIQKLQKRNMTTEQLLALKAKFQKSKEACLQDYNAASNETDSNRHNKGVQAFTEQLHFIDNELKARNVESNESL